MKIRIINGVAIHIPDLQSIGVVLYALITLGPMAILAAAAARWLWKGGAGIELGLRQMGLLGRSLGLALGVALGATVLGVLAAVILLFGSRKPSNRSIFYISLSLVALAVLPPYVHALAWMTVVDAAGRIFPQIQAQGAWLSGWVQMMSVLPIAAGMALLGLVSVECTVIEAARLRRSDLPVLLKVILPLAAPAILSGTGLCFLLSLTDYSVPSLFQVNVYALEIFAEFSASGSPERAFLLSLPLLAACGTAALALLGGLKNTAQSAARRDLTPLPPFPEPLEDERGREGGTRDIGIGYHWPAWFKGILALAGCAWQAQAGVPVITLFIRTGSWGAFVKSVTEARSELVFTLQVSLAAGLLCLPLALALAGMLAKGSRLGWGLALSPLALPAPLVGIGLVWIWNQPLGQYGGAWMLALAMPTLAMLARFSAMAALAVLAQHRRTDPSLFEAARVFQSNRLKRWLGIDLPLLAPGLLAAAGIVFVLSAGELGATLITTPPGQATLTLRIYNYLHFGASETVAGLCLLVLLVTLLAGGLAALAYGLRSAFSMRLPVRPGGQAGLDGRQAH